MAGPKQNVAQSITLPLPACLLPTVHPGVMCSPGKWRDWSDQATVFYCSVVQFWCSCTHCWHFWRWTGVSMDTLTGVRLCSHISSRLRCIVSSDTFVSEQALTSAAIWATAAHLLDRTTLASLSSQHAYDPVGGSPLFLPFTSFDNYCPLQTGTPHYSCSSGDALTQLSSHHNVALVKLGQILTLAYYSCL